MPPAPKMVVDPMVEVMVESPEVMVVTMASVVMADWVWVAVPVTLVTTAVSVVVVAESSARDC